MNSARSKRRRRTWTRPTRPAETGGRQTARDTTAASGSPPPCDANSGPSAPSWRPRCLIPAAAVAQPGQWARFRGPDAGAAADDPRLPETWSETENVVWTADIPGLGWSSPVVWDEHVFLTTAVSAGTERAPVRGLYDPGSTSGATRSTAPHRWFVYDLDFDTGAVRWVRELQSAVPQIERHLKNSFASETPVTDGERLYVYFGDDRPGGGAGPGRRAALAARARGVQRPPAIRHRGLAGAA